MEHFSENSLLNDLVTEIHSDFFKARDLKSFEVGRIILALDNSERAQFILQAIDVEIEFQRTRHALLTVITTLLNRNLPFNQNELVRLLNWLVDLPNALYYRPIAQIADQVEHYKQINLPDSDFYLFLQGIGNRLSSAEVAVSPGTRKAISKIRFLAGTDEFPIILVPGETWSDQAFTDLHASPESERNLWAQLINHLAQSNGSKPKKRWLETARSLIDEIGSERYHRLTQQWLMLVDKPPSPPRLHWPQWGPDPNYFIQNDNADVLKGIAWTYGDVDTNEAARALGFAAVSAYRKVPGVGPRCVRLGNACVWSLGQMEGQAGIGQLALLKARIKFGTAQKGIAKALNAAAEREQLPFSEIEEMAVPTYELTGVGLGEYAFGDFTAILQVTGTRSTSLTWRKVDGKVQKSVPKAVKDNHAEALKGLKQRAKDIQKMIPAQRDRIENLYLEQKIWRYEVWQERYLNHPLVGTLARRLLWRLSEGENGATVIWHNGALQDINGDSIPWLSDSTNVALWHPLEEDNEVVLAWRQWFMDNQVQQPFKQAHREIYPVTDAERTTNVYSNRFAAHVLKQHQFNALCAARGWRNKLRLMVDDEYPPAFRTMPQWGLRAEFWIEGIGDRYGVDTNPTGTFNYIATDQVRFYQEDAAMSTAHAGGGGYSFRLYTQDSPAPVPVTNVPPLVFSEIMRDVDLYVGVASVGNDPTWADSGEEVQVRHRAYWSSYAFGELTASAETRRNILKMILPKLKIGPKCELEGRFLKVEGELRTYRIHLGSGNILMAPNDQYLCIVPGQSVVNKQSNTTFLPFEGDRMMSIILSKALMLANDSKIKDRSIMNQIKRAR